MSELHRAGGWRYELEDKAFLMGFQAPAPNLPRVDIAALPVTQGYLLKFHKRELQARQNSCRGHATSSCIEKAYWCETKGQTRQYSREFSYLTGQKEDGLTGDVGASMTGGLKAAQKYGICTEEVYPYTGQYPQNGFASIPRKAFDAAKQTTLVSWRLLKNYEEVLAWLSEGIGGVQIGIHWNETCQPDPNGQLNMYAPGPFKGERDISGHALALLDWDKLQLDRSGRPYIGMANWHEDYGINGNAWIAPNIVDWWCQNMEVHGLANVAGPDIAPRDMDWTKHGFV